MNEYFVIEGEREQGPFSADELGRYLSEVSENMLERQLTFREAGSGRVLSNEELLHVLASAQPAQPGVSVEFPISFESFTQPASNPLRFRGKGHVAIVQDMIGLEGKRSRPFWFTRHDMVTIPFADILNVARAGKVVSFESEAYPPTLGRMARPITVFFKDEASAEAFAGALPQRLSHAEGIERVQRAEFSANLARRSAYSFVLPLLVAINVIMYCLLGYDGAGWVKADPKKLIEWGSNFGPLTGGGQWWRLMTSTVLHGGFAHLIVNMAVLIDTGRSCERLYGSGRFLVLYLLSGLCGSVASLWWNPLVNSVGASGAIFGVLGALLVFMLDERNGVPPSIMKRHQLTVGVFIAYALFQGFSQAGIDNAAHLGGLIGGVVLGWAFARPVDANAYSGKSALWPAAGIAVVIVTLAGLLMATPNTRVSYELQQRFAADLKWYEGEEKLLVWQTQEFLKGTKGNTVKLSELQPEANRLANAWRVARERFEAYRVDSAGSGKEVAELQADLVEYLGLRYRALNALAVALNKPGLRNDDPQLKEFKKSWQEADAVLQRISAKSHAKKELEKSAGKKSAE